MDLELEDFWSQLLSRDPEKTRSAFLSLSDDEKLAVTSHLMQMAHEEGWHSEQALSATVALEEIRKQIDQIKPDAG